MKTSFLAFGFALFTASLTAQASDNAERTVRQINAAFHAENANLVIKSGRELAIADTSVCQMDYTVSAKNGAQINASDISCPAASRCSVEPTLSSRATRLAGKPTIRVFVASFCTVAAK